MRRSETELNDRLRERLAASVAAPSPAPGPVRGGWDEGSLRTVLRPPEEESTSGPDGAPSHAPDRGSERDGFGAARGWFSSFERRHVVVVVAILTVAVLAAGYFLLRARDHPAPPTGGAVAPATSAEPSRRSVPGGTRQSGAPPSSPAGPATSATVTVHVLGEVRRPGIVRLVQGARVADAIEAAGGPTTRAVTGRLNLAQVLVDGQQIYLSSRSDRPSEVVGPGLPTAETGTASTGGGTGASRGPVNLNTATAAQLEQLPGVGPATARAIIAWRESHGRFSSVNDLQQVEGIGAKTFAKLAPLVTV